MSFLEKWLEDPVRFALLKKYFYVSLVIIALAEIILPFVFHGAEHHFGFESWPAFGSLYGFLSCVVIIMASKGIGKIWLMHRKDYYDV